MNALFNIVEQIDATLKYAHEHANELPSDPDVSEAVAEIGCARRMLVAVEGRA